MGNETLRKLARDYAIGHINKYDYRHLRSQLIDEITENPQPQEDSTSTANSIDEIVDPPLADFTAPPPEDTRNPRSSAARYRIIVIAAAILAVVIALITMTTAGKTHDPVATQSSDAVSNTAEQLVKHFVSYDEWTSERVSEFVAGWQRLPDIEKQHAHQAEWFQDLINTLKSRLAQQKTLAKSGSEQAALNVQTIKSLGRLLSVSL
jgi:hypothetical protein